MYFKKTLAFLLAAEMLLTSLAACTKDEPEETKKPETDPKVYNLDEIGRDYFKDLKKNK